MLFEENSLLPGECSSIIRQASIELEDMYDCVVTEEEMIDSHLSRFVLADNEDDQQILKSQFTKRGHRLCKSFNAKKKVVSNAMETVKTRFKSFDNPIYQHMKWLDPKVWTIMLMAGIC